MPTYKDDIRRTWYTSFYYTDWNSKKKKKKKEGFKTKKEAQEYEREFLNKAHSSCDMIFKNLIELYLEDCKSRIKPTTLNNKQYVIKNKILPYFEEMQLNKIEVITIRKWQNKLLENEKNYSQTYLKTINNQLSAIFNFAVKYYKLPNNPVAICGSIGKKNADSMKFWTVDEFKKFIDALDNKPMTKVMFELLFWTGVRSGELLALTGNDFDFSNQTVSINKNYARLNKEDLILDPKTPKSKRIITIPSFLCDLVKDYTDLIYDYDSSDRLFNVTNHHLKQEMQRVCDICGVKEIRVHDLRHSHASMLIELGFSPLLISERLGHEKVETTLQTYSHLYPNKHSEVADKLEIVRF